MKTTAELKSRLPDWTFQSYGNGKTTSAIACFPPKPPCREMWDELYGVAPISAVCGPFYLVNLTIDEFFSKLT